MKSFAGVMSATLLLEAIVMLLAIPVVRMVGGGLNGASLGYLIGVAVFFILMMGVQRKPWAIWANLAAQILPLAGALIYVGVGFIGVLFSAVWMLLAFLRSEVRRRQRSGG